MSLYTALKQAGIPLDNHESDLYALDTLQARAIVKEHGVTPSYFKSKIDGRQWLDIPLMYEPWWKARIK